MGTHLSTVSQKFNKSDLLVRMESADVDFIGKGRFCKMYQCIEQPDTGVRKNFAVKVIEADLNAVKHYLNATAKDCAPIRMWIVIID
jgi:hypothetical protein